MNAVSVDQSITVRRYNVMNKWVQYFWTTCNSNYPSSEPIGFGTLASPLIHLLSLYLLRWAFCHSHGSPVFYLATTLLAIIALKVSECPASAVNVQNLFIKETLVPHDRQGLQFLNILLLSRRGAGTKFVITYALKKHLTWKWQ